MIETGPYQEWSKSPERKARRIVVTGMGAVTPLGGDLQTSWHSLIEGKTGLQRLVHKELPTEIKVAGKVNIDVESKLTAYNIANRDLNGDIRRNLIHKSVQIGIVASAEALIQSGLLNAEGKIDSTINKERFGVYMGTVISGGADIGSDYATVLAKGRAVSQSILKVDPHRLSSAPSRLWEFRGPIKTAIAACSAGAHAIISGCEDIFLGNADIAIAGGSDAFASREIMIKYFEALQALSVEEDPQKALRAYDQFPTGTVVSEGTGVLVIETEDHAKARGAKILAIFAGYGEAADAYDAVSTTGHATQKTMEAALKRSGKPDDGIIYVNGHGGGTPGDEVELNAIITALGKYKNRAAVNSTKPSTGHMWGGTGAVEAIFAIAALRNNIIPPMINSEYPVREDIELVRNEAKESQVGLAVSTNNGLGGGAATVAFKPS